LLEEDAIHGFRPEAKDRKYKFHDRRLAHAIRLIERKKNKAKRKIKNSNETFTAYRKRKIRDVKREVR